MLEDHDRISMGGGITKDAMILGVSPQYKEVRGLVVLAGRFFDDQDSAAHAKVAVLNLPLASALYGNAQAAIGHTISIKEVPLTVIGVFKESIPTYGQSEINDETLLIPYEVGHYFTGTDNLKEIFLQNGRRQHGRARGRADHRAHPEPAPAQQRLPRPDIY